MRRRCRLGRTWATGLCRPAGAGDALTELDIQAACTLDGPTAAREPGFTYFGGLDLGISKDHAALAVVGRHNRSRRLKLVRLLSWVPPKGGRIDLAAVQEAVLQAHLAYGGLFLFDPYQAEQMAQELTRKGVRIEMQSFGGAALQQMAAAVLESFTARNLDLFSDAALVADLRKLRMVESPAGWRLAAPRTGSGGHADRAVALALALLAARKHPAATVETTQGPIVFGRKANVYGAGDGREEESWGGEKDWRHRAGSAGISGAAGGGGRGWW